MFCVTSGFDEYTAQILLDENQGNTFSVETDVLIA